MQVNETAVALAGLVGLLTGAFAVLAFHLSERERRGRTPPPPSFDDGVAAMLAALPSAAIVVGPDGDVHRTTAAAHALGLVRRGQIAHESLLGLVHAVRESGEIADQEVEVPRGLKGGDTFDLLLRVAPLGADQILILAEDHTESRRLEETRRDLVANVSHELKTPVGAIALLAETLRDAAEEPEAVRRFTARIGTESRRLGKLVQEIIEFSRLQDTDVFEHPSRVEVDEIISMAIAQSEPAATARRIALSVTGEQGLAVVGDADLLTTALRNLLDNAINYSPEDSAVEVKARLKSGKVAIDVEDHGIGIAPADATRVFERFYRVDPARSRATGGTGLGLSIVKHVAANHGGQVKLRSQLGEGTTVTLELPRRDTSGGLLRGGMADGGATGPDRADLGLADKEAS